METLNAVNVVVQTETSTYMTETAAVSQPFHGEYGSILGLISDPVSARIRPVVSRVLNQDGVNFGWQVSQFDTLARPRVVVKSSTVAGNPTRTEETTYNDNLTKWVLGQVSRVVCTAPTTALPVGCGITGTEMFDRSYDATYALPLVTKQFGKLQQTLTYDTTSTAASGQLGTVKTVKDGNNNTTTLTSWKRGIPQSIAYADATSQSAVVNDSGWVTSVTDQNGYLTGYSYDAMGRLSGITYPTGDSTVWNSTTQAFAQITSTEYGIASGHWRQTVSTGNGNRVTYFDGLWRPLLVREFDAANEPVTTRFQRYAYDHQGRVTFAAYPGTTDALTTGTWTQYDALGRATSVSQDSELSPSLLTTSTQYLTGFQTKTTDPKGNITTTGYLAYDQPTTDWPTAITHPAGAYTDIARDAFGKITAITRRNSANSVAITRSYTYNANQELCRAVEPETGATLMGYDAAGNLKWSAAGLAGSTACDATGTNSTIIARKAARTYDARNRLKTLTFPDGLGNQSWTYTPDGKPSTLTAYNAANSTAAATTTYAYNKRRLLTQETLSYTDAGANRGGTINYVYDANANLASQTYPGNLTINYAPNALGQPTQVKDAGGQSYASAISYYPNGAIQGFTYGNGIVHKMLQNARQLPAQSIDCTAFLLSSSCTTANSRLNLAYTFDKNANVSQIVDGVDGRQTRGMSYDALDRLTQTTSNMFGTASYAYDVLDNLTQVNISAGDHARNQFHCYTNNQLTNIKTGSCAGATVTGLGYDVQGNLNNRNGTTYNFDYGNRLRSAATTNTYAYDALGRRVRDTTSAGSKYSQYSQGGQILYANDLRTTGGATTTQYIYLGSSLIAFREAKGTTTTIKYQHTDALGTPIATTDSNKNIAEKFEYEPYGQQINGTQKDGPGYTGHVQDAATGLINMQDRYMDPLLGIFVSEDAITPYSNPIGSFNRTRYANDNPFKFTDPDGRCPESSTRRACIEATVAPTTNKNITVSAEQASAAKAGKSVVTVSSGGSKEKLGSVNRQTDGSLKVEAVAGTTTSTTSTAYKATGTLPSNAEVVIHGHLAESGLMDEKGTLGDAGTIATSDKANIAVSSDGRMAAHELENGTYQVRALNGNFTPNEIRHFQHEVDKRQEFFNASGQ